MKKEVLERVKSMGKYPIKQYPNCGGVDFYVRFIF